MGYEAQVGDNTSQPDEPVEQSVDWTSSQEMGGLNTVDPQQNTG